MKFLQTALTLSVIATGAMTATAGVQLLSPNPAEVQTVETLSSVALKWDTEDTGTELNEHVRPYVNDANGNLVAMTDMDCDMADYSVINLSIFPELKTPGEYTLVITPKITPDLDNEQIEIKYNVTGKLTADSPVPNYIYPSDGAVFDWQWDMIHFEFDNAIWYKESKIKLVGPDGPVAYTCSGFANPDNPMFQNLGGQNPFLNLDFNSDGSLAKGEYTLTVEAGAFMTADGETNPEAIVYKYTNNYQKIPSDPTPLELTNIQIVKIKPSGEKNEFGNPVYIVDEEKEKIDFVPGMALHNFTDEDGILFDMNHGYKTAVCEYEYKYEVVEPDETYYMYENGGTAQKLADGKWLIAWPGDMFKFNNETNYRIEVRAYSEGGSWNRAEFGDGYNIDFTGAGEAYKYSDVEFVACVPDESNSLKSVADNVVTVIFSGKVVLEDRTCINTGMGSSVPFAKIESKEGRKNPSAVWYLTIPETQMDQTTINMGVWAKDLEGRAVLGETAQEADSYISLTVNSEVGMARIIVEPGNNVVDKLDYFTVTARNAHNSNRTDINPSWMAKPVLKDLNNKVVATLDETVTDNEFYYEGYEVLETSGSGMDAQAAKLGFKMTPAVTEPGEYILEFPFNVFACGNQFTGVSSRSTEYRYTVAAHHSVSYSVDHHAIDLAPVAKGNTTTLNLNVAEGWKLGKLTQNDTDITENVKDGKVVTNPINENTVIAAEFVFDGVVTETTGKDEVITDFNLRAWSEDGTIFVAGLNEGQQVDIYTAGGALVDSNAISTSNTTLKSTLPAGVYIVVVSAEGKREAIKILN